MRDVKNERVERRLCLAKRKEGRGGDDGERMAI